MQALNMAVQGVYRNYTRLNSSGTRFLPFLINRCTIVVSDSHFNCDKFGYLNYNGRCDFAPNKKNCQTQNVGRLRTIYVGLHSTLFLARTDKRATNSRVCRVFVLSHMIIFLFLESFDAPLYYQSCKSY